MKGLMDNHKYERVNGSYTGMRGLMDNNAGIKGLIFKKYMGVKEGFCYYCNLSS